PEQSMLWWHSEQPASSIHESIPRKNYPPFQSHSNQEKHSMTTTTTAARASATSTAPTGGFWERLYAGAANTEFRQSGLNFVVFSIVPSVIYGYQPQVGASADALVAFYSGERTRILIAAVISGLNVLNLMWFAVTLRTALADAGQDGWGAAATA